jgi:hypothetical protein
MNAPLSRSPISGTIRSYLRPLAAGANRPFLAWIVTPTEPPREPRSGEGRVTSAARRREVRTTFYDARSASKPGLARPVVGSERGPGAAGFAGGHDGAALLSTLRQASRGLGQNLVVGGLVHRLPNLVPVPIVSPAMDQVAVATVNAAVLTIYEAVLALVFGYAQRPAQRLKREGHLVEQALAAARRRSREFTEALRSEQLAAMVPHDPVRALALTNRLVEPDRPAVSPVWDIGEEEHEFFKGPELWLTAEDQAIDLGARAAYDKLRTEGDQGLVLLAILSWYAQREPFTGYHLGRAKGIAAWQRSLTSGENKVGLMAFRLRANLERVKALTSAAVQQEFLAQR